MKLLVLGIYTITLVVSTYGTVIPTQYPKPDICKDAMAKIDELLQTVKSLKITVAELDADKKCISNMTDMQQKFDTQKKQLNQANGEKLQCLQANQELINALSSSKQQQDQTNSLLNSTIVDLERCKAITAKYPQNCQEWKTAGYLTDGEYIIDLDGTGNVSQVSVDCDMNGASGHAVTIMHHNREARTVLKKCGGRHCQSIDIKYKASMAQIIALIKQSQRCEQFMKYDCYHSYLLKQNGKSFGAWYSRDGQQMDYWGGATPGSNKCACGMTNSCDKPGFDCNCDIGDALWRSDSGFVTDRNSLPVAKLTFGDTDDGGTDGFRLGPLRCYN